MKLNKIFIILIFVSSCVKSQSQSEYENSAFSTENGSSRVWGETCNQCQNLRSPDEYSDLEWDAVGFHMRVHASLTDQQNEKFLEMMKAGNN